MAILLLSLSFFSSFILNSYKLFSSESFKLWILILLFIFVFAFFKLSEFIKPNNKINLKRHNANANIVINKNFKNFIQDRKYFYTLNKENIRHKSFTKDKKKKKQKNEEEEDDEKNLSV